MANVTLPLVDFSILNINDVSESDVAALRENDKLKPLVDKIMMSLKEMRFCYLKNSGLSEEKMRELFTLTREVCHLSEDVKQNYARRDDALMHGYSNRGIERPKDTSSVERYETFMVCPRLASFWPDEVPEFKTTSMAVFRQFEVLSDRVFDVITRGLNLKDSTFMRDCHLKDHGELRSSLYHRYPDHFVPKPGQLRFFQHCDLGTVSFIYQDGVGGLEAETNDGTWISLPPIPGTVLLFTGQLMQIWTADRLKALLHRVIIPPDQATRQKDRHSLTFFPVPPDDFEIRCLDGSNKYDPVTIKTFSLKKLSEGTFGKLN